MTQKLEEIIEKAKTATKGDDALGALRRRIVLQRPMDHLSEEFAQAYKLARTLLDLSMEDASEELDVDELDESIIHSAIHGHKNIIRVVLDKGFDVKRNLRSKRQSIHYAAAGGSCSVIDLLSWG